MAFHVPANQTVSFSVYMQAVANECGLTYDFMKVNAHRVTRAFDAGEPIWMIVAELKMIHEAEPNWRPTKTPRQLAARVVRA